MKYALMLVLAATIALSGSGCGGTKTVTTTVKAAAPPAQEGTVSSAGTGAPPGTRVVPTFSRDLPVCGPALIGVSTPPTTGCVWKMAPISAPTVTTTK